MTRAIAQSVCDRLRRLVETYGTDVAAELTGVHRRTVQKIAARGFTAASYGKPRPRPSDFAIQQETMTIAELAAYYSAGWATVRRWGREIGRERHQPIETRPTMPIPDDLAVVVAEKGASGAAVHFGVSYGTILRWRRIKQLPVGWSRNLKNKHAGRDQIGWAERYHQERRA